MFEFVAATICSLIVGVHFGFDLGLAAFLAIFALYPHGRMG